MTDQEIRIAIAVECGWKMKPTNPNDPILGTEKEVFCAPGKGWNMSIPDYLNDLNAMSKAEQFGDEDDLREYLENLNIVCSRDMREPEIATARQRAEAFLRTFGKWKD